MNKIVPNLWINRRAPEAVKFYLSVFRKAKLKSRLYYNPASARVARKRPGELLAATFLIEGQPFTIINSEPSFKFTPAVSFLIACKDQAEVDYYWRRLTAGGKEGPCGWLTDKYGVAWQVAPRGLERLLSGDPARAERVFNAMLKMKKLDIAALRAA